MYKCQFNSSHYPRRDKYKGPDGSKMFIEERENVIQEIDVPIEACSGYRLVFHSPIERKQKYVRDSDDSADSSSSNESLKRGALSKTWSDGVIIDEM